MKIVHVISYFQPLLGYQEYYVAREQQRLGHDVSMITSDRYMPWFTERIVGQGVFHEEGLNVYRLPCLYEFGTYIAVKNMRKTLKKIKPDVVHAHEIQTLTPAIPAFYKQFLTYKYLITTGSYIIPYLYRNWKGKLLFSALKGAILDYAVKRADGIFATTPASLKLFSDMFNIPPKHIWSTSLGVDTDLFKPNGDKRKEMRKKLGFKDDDVVVIFAGRVEPGKNIQMLLRAVANVNRENVKLLIVGGAPIVYLDRLKNIAQTLGILRNVVFHSLVHRTHLAELYTAADISVWPYTRSIGILESLGAGLPIVINRRFPSIDNYPYVDYADRFIRYDNGLAYEAGDIDGLTGCLEKLISDEKLRKRMGLNSRKLAEDRYDWRLISRRLIKIYNELLSVRTQS